MARATERDDIDEVFGTQAVIAPVVEVAVSEGPRFATHGTGGFSSPVGHPVVPPDFMMPMRGCAEAIRPA